METTETPDADQLHADIRNYTSLLTVITAINNNGCSILPPDSPPPDGYDVGRFNSKLPASSLVINALAAASVRSYQIVSIAQQMTPLVAPLDPEDSSRLITGFIATENADTSRAKGTGPDYSLVAKGTSHFHYIQGRKPWRCLRIP